MDIGIIVQARKGSTRLPDKMVLPFYNGKGILELILENLVKSRLGKTIVLATTTNAIDDELVNIGKKVGIGIFRGDEKNVLSRYIEASEKFMLRKIIRVCADNPFLDMQALKEQITKFESLDDDYLCFGTSAMIPTIKTHYGFWSEGVSLDALKRIKALTTEQIYLEHVTNFIYTHPQLFAIHFDKIDSSIEKEKFIRLTVDTFKDFNLAQSIYLELIENEIPFNANAITDFVRENEHWIKSMKEQIAENIK